MMGEKELLSFQLGTQSVFATAVAGTVKLMGITDAQFKPSVKTTSRKHLRGSRAPSYTALVTGIDGSGSWDEDCSYEDIGYGLEGLHGTVAPSGGSAPYTRDYAAPLGSTLTPRIYTGILGDADGVYKLMGALVAKAVYKCDKEGVWTVKHDLVGRDVSTGSLAALSDRTVNLIAGAETSIYIDAWAGTIGSTHVDATAYSFELTIDAKRAVKHYLNNSLYAGNYRQPAWDVTLKLHLEFNATSKAYLDAILASTVGAPFQRQVRIKATRDSSASEKLAQFDFAGSHSGAEIPAPTWENDVWAVDLDLTATYHATLANYFKAQIKNAVATLV
jgi:hypothetical protein